MLLVYTPRLLTQYVGCSVQGENLLEFILENVIANVVVDVVILF